MHHRAAAPAAVVLAFMLSTPGLISAARAVRSDDPLLASVRSDNGRILEVLAYAIQKSPSFRDLLATLNLFDRTVYIEEGHCGRGREHACVQVMPTPGGRNLLVHVNPRLQSDLVVAQLAHELYHAIEIAREPDVVDSASLRALYQRIGERSCSYDSDDCWETRAAVAFEALVRRQLHGGTSIRVSIPDWTQRPIVQWKAAENRSRS